MPYKSVNDFINLIDGIDTYGHAELIKQKMAALQSLQDRLSVIWDHPLTDDPIDSMVVATDLTPFCNDLTKILKTNGAIFAEPVDTVKFDRIAATTFSDELQKLATIIAKKQAILLDKSAADFLDEQNIDTVRDSVEKERDAAQVALNTAQAQTPAPDLAPLQAKLGALIKPLAIIDRIRNEAQQMKACREELQNAIAAQTTNLDALNKAMTDYNAAVKTLNESLSAYNRHASDARKISPPVSPPTRELSTARIAANWTVQVGVDSNGIGHGICTDKDQITRLTQLAEVRSSVATTLMNSGTAAVPTRRAALLETEIPYSVRNYTAGKDQNQPASLLVIQHQEHNKVTDCSTNLDLDQKRMAALEMAKMYAINYQEGPVQIRGEDPKMAAMLHAALLMLIPGVEIKNYVSGDDVRPSWSNSSFINRHFPDAKATHVFDDAIIAVKSERAKAKDRAEKVATINKRHDDMLGEGFFDRNQITELRKQIARAPDQKTQQGLQQRLEQTKEQIEQQRAAELKKVEVDSDPEDRTGLKNG